MSEMSDLEDDLRTWAKVSNNGTMMIRAADRIAALERENFALSAGQCPHTDGTGLVGDEYGNAVCIRQLTPVSADRLRTWAAMLGDGVPGKNLARVQVRDDILAALQERSND